MFFIKFCSFAGSRKFYADTFVFLINMIPEILQPFKLV